MNPRTVTTQSQKITDISQFTLQANQLVKNIRAYVGFPARPTAKISRSQLKLDQNYKIHLDIGGEGVNDTMGIPAGFPNAINVNDRLFQSNDKCCPIPNLVKINKWSSNPSYPFADGFANCITMQNAPLTNKNVEEMSRCLCPGGEIDLWVRVPLFKDNIELLAKKLNSKPEYNAENEFPESDFPKTKIVSGIKPDLSLKKTISYPVIPKKNLTNEIQNTPYSYRNPVPLSKNPNRFQYANATIEKPNKLIDENTNRLVPGVRG